MKSPITNEDMSKRQIPAIQIRNHIQMLVEHGFVEDDLAERWNQQMEQKKTDEYWIKLAESDDADGMETAGDYYLAEKEYEEAFLLFERAHSAGRRQ